MKRNANLHIFCEKSKFLGVFFVSLFPLNIKNMIIITGAAGFIGSCLLSRLNQEGYENIVLVDDFSNPEKKANYADKKYIELVNRAEFFEWLNQKQDHVGFVFHIGARTDTTEFRKEIFDELNVDYSKKLWNFCASHNIPMIYASSAATYGMGEHGYDDDETLIPSLKPLNPYGESKNEFDKWVLEQKCVPPFWAGLKFFNVYGPNEYHKGRMASVIFHAYNQIRETGGMKLFRSHRPDFQDGMQLRDFIYVKDLVDVMYFLMLHQKDSGIYNLGTGKARAFVHLAQATFKALGEPENISFVDTPADIRDKYQYFTEANMNKLRKIGYNKPFTSLEDGVKEYVQNYLMKHAYL